MGDGVDLVFSDSVIGKFNFGVKEFEFPELVDGVIDRVSGIAAVVRVSKSGLGPGFSFKVGGRERVEVLLGGVGKKRPGVFSIEIIK